MTIKEAQKIDPILTAYTPFAMAFLTEEQAKSIVYLKERVEKKKAKYPKYFKKIQQ